MLSNGVSGQALDEKGAKGASETHIQIDLAPDGPGVPREYKISLDRPFIYLIEEQSTGAIIFIGSIDKL